MSCPCSQYCRDGSLPLTEHHPQCEKYNLESESLELVNKLIRGIEQWGADEDGIHDDVYDIYCKALVFTGQLNKLKKYL